MNIILQNRKTNLFVAHDQWNPQQTQAKHFSSGLAAYDYCIEEQLHDMDIILAFASDSYNVRVAVRERLARPVQR